MSSKKNTMQKAKTDVPNSNILYCAEDCSPIQGEKVQKKFIAYNKTFITQIDTSVISFSKNGEKRQNSKDDNQFVSFGKDGTLYAGRWIGCDLKEELEVKPRFGYDAVAMMLSEAFSFNALDSKGGLKKSDGANFMKVLIPYIWNLKLSSANKYGIPRKTIDVEHFGFTIKGRVNARKSIIPMHLTDKVFSISREKQVDVSMAQIICTAYDVLKKNYLQIPKLSEKSESILAAFKSVPKAKAANLNKIYRSIRYKSIYQSYKDIVDFSWQIIILTSQNFVPKNLGPAKYRRS